MPNCSYKQLKTSRFIRVLILSGIDPPTQPVVFVEIQGKVIFSEPSGTNKEQSINKEFKEVHSKDTELLHSLHSSSLKFPIRFRIPSAYCQ